MPSRPIRSAIFWTAFHAVLWIVPTLALAWVMPRCMRVFADYGLDLRGTTMLADRVGRMIAVGFPAAIAMIATILAVDFAAIRRFTARAEERETARLWIATMTAVPLAYVLFAAVGIAVPLLEIRSKIRG